jgi:hypothetical protein
MNRWLLTVALLCGLLAVAVSASAQSWVLWRETGSTVSPDHWQVESAWGNKRQCEAASAVAVERAVAKSDIASGWTVVPDKDSPRSSYTTRSREGLWVTTFRCLPDTIDPRGPKAK